MTRVFFEGLGYDRIISDNVVGKGGWDHDVGRRVNGRESGFLSIILGQ